ncbi:hypothetical protein JCM5353_000458 [Sporobolomyces roseus]
MKSISLFTLVGAVASISTSVSAHSPHSDSSIHRRFHHKQLASLQAETTALAVRGESDENKHELMKRGNFNGRATFFDPGLGACGTYSSGNDFMVAMNQAQYGDLGAVSPWCFQTITISYGGKTAQAQVLDACPGCPYGGLDMSPALFRHFADESVGVIYMEWSSGGGSQQEEPTTKKTTTTTTTTTTPWVPPTTTWKPTTTWEPTTTTTTWTPPTTSSRSTTTTQSSSSTEFSSSSTTTTDSITSSSLNSTLSSSSSSSSSASSSAVSASTSATLHPEAIGGNLDGISQLVIAMGNVAGAAVANPMNA